MQIDVHKVTPLHRRYRPRLSFSRRLCRSNECSPEEGLRAAKGGRRPSPLEFMASYNSVYESHFTFVKIYEKNIIDQRKIIRHCAVNATIFPNG